MIYLPGPVDGYDGAQFMDDDCGHQFLLDSDGKSIAEGWQPRRVRLFTTRRDWRPADFPSTDGIVLVMRRRALTAMGDLFADYGEVLPLVPYRGEQLFLLNVTRVIDALDVERSDIFRFDDGRIGVIHAPAFIEPLVRDVHMFKLPSQRINEIFVSTHFVERVQAAGLTGMKFDLAWSPEGGPVPRRIC